jgi:hypothetical protein
MGTRLIPLGVLILAFGCSSGSGAGSTGTTNPGDPATPEGFCNGTFGRLIDSLDATCTAADKQTGSYQFLFGFMQVLVSQCPVLLESSIESGRAAIDGNAAATCVSAYDEIVAQINVGSVENIDPGILAACQSVIVGKQAIGAPCAQPYECPAGASCVGKTGSTDGTCQNPAIGDACGNGESESGEITITMNFGNHPECATGAFCDSAYQNGEYTQSCVALKADGEDCFDEDECAVGACYLGQCSGAGPSPVGGECLTGDDCTGGHYCDDSATPSVCAPQKPNGAACSGGLSSDECAGACSQAEGASSGTCVSFCGTG